MWLDCETCSCSLSYHPRFTGYVGGLGRHTGSCGGGWQDPLKEERTPWCGAWGALGHAGALSRGRVSLSADIYLNVLNNSYDRMYL